MEVSNMKGLMTTVYFIVFLAVVVITVVQHIKWGTDPSSIAMRAVVLLYCGRELKDFILED